MSPMLISWKKEQEDIAEVASLLSLVVSWGLLAITLTCNLNVFFFY